MAVMREQTRSKERETTEGTHSSAATMTARLILLWPPSGIRRERKRGEEGQTGAMHSLHSPSSLSLLFFFTYLHVEVVDVQGTKAQRQLENPSQGSGVPCTDDESCVRPRRSRLARLPTLSRTSAALLLSRAATFSECA